MKTVSIIGSMVVTIALVFYSIGFIKERRKQLVSSGVLLFYTIGVTLDITATILMIIGSSKDDSEQDSQIGFANRKTKAPFI